jgi:hypothetical protein
MCLIMDDLVFYLSNMCGEWAAASRVLKFFTDTLEFVLIITVVYILAVYVHHFIDWTTYTSSVYPSLVFIIHILCPYESRAS